ncbi:MAG: hypothetical protein FD181_2087 [Prolixibacteraceae bacterium]|nr:MAG: hypothetical protein FD181_2087 [Prolixibacteraceae bacterium]
MKTLTLIIIALAFSVGFSFAQQSVYVHKAGSVDYQTSISSIDSMKISVDNNFEIYKDGNIDYQTPVAFTDSITFFAPGALDTSLYRLNTCDWAFKYVDTFDDANNTDGNKGLNDNLNVRQLYNPDFTGITWTRTSGSAVAGTTINTTYSQVNRSIYPDVLTFTSTAGNTAGLMLNTLIDAGIAERYQISFTANPLTLEQASKDWISFMLDESNTKDGHVTLTQLGFLISSDGSVQVYQNGHEKTITGSVPAAASYQVVLDINQYSLIATINGSKIMAFLDEPLPTKAYAYLGALFNNSSKFSTVDELVIATPYSKAAKHVVNYGYYWVDRAYGTHFSEIANYTNFNFVEFIDATTPNTKTNVVQVRWQFWVDASGKLRPDWEFQWNHILPNLKANLHKIKAIYVFDEPFWAAPIPVADFNMVMDRIKADMPGMPLVTALAYTTVNDTDENGWPTGTIETDIAQINSSLDIIGANKYVSVFNFSQITTMYNNLLKKRPSSTNLMLIPQTFFLGTKTDAEIAEINWLFYKLALEMPNVSTIFNFGLWCFAKPSEVPITLKAQRIIGKAVTTY